MNQRLLITGASGFVGRQVLKSLLDREVSICCVTRKKSQASILESSKIKDCISTSNLFAESEEWWEEAMGGIHTVIHIAWYSEAGKYQLSNQNMECLTGTIRMANAAVRAGVKRFVGIGTCAEYDLSDKRLTVNSPLNPKSPYAAAKVAAYLTLSHYLPLHGIDFAWIRPFYLYGEGEDQRRFIPTLINSLNRGKPVSLTSGNQVRDYLDVREAGRQIADISYGNKTGVFNVCSGKAITIREIAESKANEIGRKDLLRFNSRPDNPFDPIYVVGVPYKIEKQNDPEW